MLVTESLLRCEQVPGYSREAETPSKDALLVQDAKEVTRAEVHPGNWFSLDFGQVDRDLGQAGHQSFLS